jgi:threonine/homoserine/homoserine lactone efflux protein
MQSYSAFAFAILALLLTPGPTNTLLALSGAGRGVRASLPLMLGEICGYLLVVVPLTMLASEFLATHTAISQAIKLCSAVWVSFLAIRLWTLPQSTATAHAITVRRVFVTTCLNPKAIIIALVLMPQGSVAELLPYIAMFSMLIICVALVWLSAGSFLIRGASEHSPRLVRCVASVFLMVLSLGLAGNVFGIL